MKKETKKGSLAYLLVISIAVAVGGFLFGFDTAVISGTIIFVKNKFMLDAVSEGYLVSSALAGCIIGVSAAGALSDRFGPKKILFISALLFASSGILTSLPHTYPLILTGRIIGGLGIGIASMLSPLFISEFSPPEYRGRMVTLYQLAITIGIVTAYFSNALLLHVSQSSNPLFAPGSFLNYIFIAEVWRGMFATLLFPALLFLLLLLFVPESPRWLIKKGDEERAGIILSKVSGSEKAGREIEEVKKALNAEEGSLKQLLKPGMRLALLIGILLPFFSQISGINVVIYYGPTIFKEAGFALSDAFGSQVTIGIINVLFTLFAIWKIDSFGRRPLLLWGVAGVSVSLIIIGFFFYFNFLNSYILLALFLFFIASFAFSFGPVCWVIIAEIFPTRIRGRAMSIATLSLWITNAVIGQLFPYMLETIKAYGTFWLFAGTSVIAFVFIYKVIPETKNKSLEEIEDFWTHK